MGDTRGWRGRGEGGGSWKEGGREEGRKGEGKWVVGLRSFFVSSLQPTLKLSLTTSVWTVATTLRVHHECKTI